MRFAIIIVAVFSLLVAIAGLSLHSSAKQAHACSVPGPPPMIEVLEGADSAFIGKVISIDSQQIKGEEYPTFEDIIEFKANEVWKGEPYETMFVKTTWVLLPSPDGPLICPKDPIFSKGVSYIVFVWEGETHLSINSSTQELRYAPRDQIKALGTGKTPIPGSISPIPEREGLPVGGCNLPLGYAFGSIDLSLFGLGTAPVWFWLRRRIRR